MNMVEGLTPLFGTVTSQVAVNIVKDTFTYKQDPKLQHFNLVEDIVMISRHFIELSNTNIQEVKQMVANLTPNCE